MRILIYANNEASHDYFISKIINKYTSASFIILRNSSKGSGVKTKFWKTLSLFVSPRLAIFPNRILQLDKFKKLRVYFGSEPSVNTKQIISDSFNQTFKLGEIDPVSFDGMLVFGGKLIPNEFISKFKGWVLHLHCGIVPYYRGGTTWFSNFAYNDLENCGFTIQDIDEGIDTGEIITQYQIKLDRTDTVWDAYCKCVVAGTEAVCQLIGLVISNPEYKFKKSKIKTNGFNHTGKFLFDKRRMKKTVSNMRVNAFKIEIADSLVQNELADFTHKFIVGR